MVGWMVEWMRMVEWLNVSHKRKYIKDSYNKRKIRENTTSRIISEWLHLLIYICSWNYYTEWRFMVLKLWLCVRIWRKNGRNLFNWIKIGLQTISAPFSIFHSFSPVLNSQIRWIRDFGYINFLTHISFFPHFRGSSYFTLQHPNIWKSLRPKKILFNPFQI